VHILVLKLVLMVPIMFGGTLNSTQSVSQWWYRFMYWRLSNSLQWTESSFRNYWTIQ